jgi:DNA invertase Pin-like site-specific DNA recombinase
VGRSPPERNPSGTTLFGGMIMKVGYVRVSTTEQNTMRQEVLMQELCVEQIYIDKASGKNTDRSELKRMMDYVRAGDTVICESISRFARNTRDLLELVERLTAKGVEFISKKEAIDTTTPTGKFMLTIFGAVAELEREYILQRQREGIAIAKQEGKYKGRKAIINPDFDKTIKKWRSGELTAVQAMKKLGMSKTAFYRNVKKMDSAI